MQPYLQIVTLFANILAFGKNNKKRIITRAELGLSDKLQDGEIAISEYMKIRSGKTCRRTLKNKRKINFYFFPKISSTNSVAPYILIRASMIPWE